MAVATLGLAAVLVPWTVFLAVTLPPHYSVRHWDVTWVGFDAALVVVLAWTAWAAWTRRRVTAAGLLVVATLLLCDAWFDVTTSLGRGDSWVPIVSALAGELPLAGACVWLARSGVVSTPTKPGLSSTGEGEDGIDGVGSGSAPDRTSVGAGRA